MTFGPFHALGIMAVPLLVAVNAFFVAAEFALVTVRRTRVAELVRQGRFGASAVSEAVKNLDDAIAATQLGITFASLGLGWLGEPPLAALIEPLLGVLPGIVGTAAAHAVAAVLAILAITFLHVVLGELAPKAIALQRAEDVALIVAGPLLLFGRVLRPLIRVMNGAGNWVVRCLRLPAPRPGMRVHSVEELRMLLEEAEQAGHVPAGHSSWLMNVFGLADRRVRDVMVPRERVVCIALDAPPEEVLRIAHESAHTRMPVWDGRGGNVVGVVETRDLFRLDHREGRAPLRDAMRPALFVDAEQPLARVLRTLKRERRSMAVVRDSRRPFTGIVTVKDIVDEIVGDFMDARHAAPAGAGESVSAVRDGAPPALSPL